MTNRIKVAIYFFTGSLAVLAAANDLKDPHVYLQAALAGAIAVKALYDSHRVKG